jgi:hypothetical protein
MSQERKPTKAEIEAMLGDYQPEVIEYDPKVDSKAADTPHKEITEKPQEAPAAATSKKPTKEEIEAMLKNYQPETVEYDPEIDGGDEHKVRDERLKEKDELKDVITRLKEKNRGTRKVRR